MLTWVCWLVLADFVNLLTNGVNKNAREGGRAIELSYNMFNMETPHSRGEDVSKLQPVSIRKETLPYVFFAAQNSV
ncbi:MAG: hypothetical protein DDT32_00287 [Syntrophomonadaceae bacterium]|nr:hypothetical protein [Bacillota bacterium]